MMATLAYAAGPRIARTGSVLPVAGTKRRGPACAGPASAHGSLSLRAALGVISPLPSQFVRQCIVRRLRRCIVRNFLFRLVRQSSTLRTTGRLRNRTGQTEHGLHIGSCIRSAWLLHLRKGLDGSVLVGVLRGFGKGRSASCKRRCRTRYPSERRLWLRPWFAVPISAVRFC